MPKQNYTSGILSKPGVNFSKQNLLVILALLSKNVSIEMNDSTYSILHFIK